VPLAQVEPDSLANRVYVMLLHSSQVAPISDLVVTPSEPSFVGSASVTFVPAEVPVGSGRIVAVEFDVLASASVGETGNLVLGVSGSVEGAPLDFDVILPLEVVSAARLAQGVTGSEEPVPANDDPDSDGDGVSDQHELAFGSDPDDATSIPGKSMLLSVPLGAWTWSLIAALIASLTWIQLRRTRIGSAGEVVS